MRELIGRKLEIEELERYVASDRAEFVAIYGRRRIGKTFLVNNVFRDRLSFSMTGIIDGTFEEQMHVFADAMSIYGKPLEKSPKNWLEAFSILRDFLIQQKKPKSHRIVFIDELPCFDTQRSGFVRALGYFWNSWASQQDDLTLIVCGSATSWMVSKIIDNHGGLHNRITQEMHLQPFSLAETENYFSANGFSWGRNSILQAYMVFGGVPYYMSLLRKDMSLAKNIDRMFFAQDAILKYEYDRLFQTLFNSPEPYKHIVKLLSENKSGLTRKELSEKLGMKTGGNLTTLLQNLVRCDFVRLYNVKGKKIKSSSGIYQIKDFFSLFHITFIQQKVTTNEHFWSDHIDTPAQNTWYGLTFEQVCMAHIPQIKKALGIDRINTEYYSWRSRKSSENVQIDLVIERSDGNTNICEIKYSKSEYSIDAEEEKRLNKRIDVYKSETKTDNGLQLTMITSAGLKHNSHSDGVSAEVTLDHLFSE
jgi:hypothetical protein